MLQEAEVFHSAFVFKAAIYLSQIINHISYISESFLKKYKCKRSYQNESKVDPSASKSTFH